MPTEVLFAIFDVVMYPSLFPTEFLMILIVGLTLWWTLFLGANVVVDCTVKQMCQRPKGPSQQRAA